MTVERYGEHKGPIPDHVRQVLETANEQLRRGGKVFFKFTCVGCGARQTFEEPNVFWLKGQCEECGHVTDLYHPEAAVNFMLVLGA